MFDMETVFTKIRDGIIPSAKLYQDEECFVILDINPVHKGHALVIANEPYCNTLSCPEETLKHMIAIAKKIDEKQRKELKCDGSNIIINNDPASGQEVPHLHIHVIPRYNNDGNNYVFSHEKYVDDEMEEMKKKLEI